MHVTKAKVMRCKVEKIRGRSCKEKGKGSTASFFWEVNNKEGHKQKIMELKAMETKAVRRHGGPLAAYATADIPGVMSMSSLFGPWSSSEGTLKRCSICWSQEQGTVVHLGYTRL